MSGHQEQLAAMKVRLSLFLGKGHDLVLERGSPGGSRNAVPQPVFIDDFAQSTRNGSRNGASQAVTIIRKL